MSHARHPALPSLLAGAGLGLHAAGLLRVHGLLAGTGPVTGLAVAGAVLAAWALGARTRHAARSGHAVAALAAAAATFVAPVAVGLSSGVPAALVTAALAALPAWGLGRAAPGRLSAPLLLGLGLGLPAAALFALPFAGPTVTGLGAALLLGAAALAARLTDSAGAPAEGTEPAEGREPVEWGPAVEPLAAWTCAAGIAAALAGELRAWPFALAAAGCAALGAALGLALPGNAGRRLALALAASALLVPGLLPALGVSAAELVGSPARPLVSPLWGGLATFLAALGNGFGGGLVAGLVLPRPRLGGLALSGLLLLALSLVPATLAFGHSSFAVVGLAGLLAVSLAPPLRRHLDSPGAGAAIAFGLFVVLALPTFFGAGLAGPWNRPGRSVELGFDFAAEPPRGRVTLDGRPLVETGPRHRPDEVLAGQLAGLLPAGRRAALVVGTRSGEVLTALEAQGFEEIVLRETSRELARAAVTLAGLEAPPEVAAAPSAWPETPGGWDAIVIQADDPSVPEWAPLFTASAWRGLADRLASGGLVVQRLDLSRLGPEGLLRVVRLVQQALPETWIATADLARDGSALLLARAPHAEGARLPWNRLVLDPAVNPRLDEASARQLKSVLLFKPSDLLETFAAGPRELAELEPDGSALEPWSPGASALAWPAPEEGARQLARAMLYARLGTVELQLDVQPLPARPPWQHAWTFAGVETKLGEGWSFEGGLLREANRYRPAFGDFGLYRDASRKLAWTKGEQGRLEVAELQRSVAGPDTVNASARSLIDEHVFRTFDALVHGHRAAGLVRQPSEKEQHLHLTWHCPVQGRLFLVDYRVDEPKPGLYEVPLQWLGQSLRCHHPEAGESP